MLSCVLIFIQTFEFAAYLHDAISLYAIGLNRSVSRGGNKTDGLAIISKISNAEVLFTGIVWERHSVDVVCLFLLNFINMFAVANLTKALLQMLILSRQSNSSKNFINFSPG